MIRVALCLLLGGCTVVEHVQVWPALNPRTNTLSCCIAYIEASSSADGSIEVQNSETKGISVKLGARLKF